MQSWPKTIPPPGGTAHRTGHHGAVPIGPGSRRCRAAACLALLVALLVPAAAPPAGAHVLLVRSEPAPGAVVDGLDRATLTFSAQLAADGHLVVATGGGTQRSADRYEVVDASTLVAHFAPPLGEGSQELAWQAVGLDGHRISGLLAFTVAGAAAGADPAAPPAPTSVPVADGGRDGTGSGAGTDGAGPMATDDDGGSSAAALAVLVAVALAVLVVVAVARSRRPARRRLPDGGS